MQDRYYKNYGILTGFLQICAFWIFPRRTVFAEAVDQIVQRTEQAQKADSEPFFANSYAAAQKRWCSSLILFRNERVFWDVSRLEGVVFDRELTPNLKALAEQAAYGRCYSPVLWRRYM